MPWGPEAQSCQIKIEVSICFIVFPHQSGAVCPTALLANNKGHCLLKQTSPPQVLGPGRLLSLLQKSALHQTILIPHSVMILRNGVGVNLW